MGGVKDYAAGLSSIVAANTKAGVDAAVTSVKTNLLTLAKDGDALNQQLTRQPGNLENTISRFASPVADLTGFALNKARLKA